MLNSANSLVKSLLSLQTEQSIGSSPSPPGHTFKKGASPVGSSKLALSSNVHLSELGGMYWYLSYLSRARVEHIERVRKLNDGRLDRYTSLTETDTAVYRRKDVS